MEGYVAGFRGSRKIGVDSFVASLGARWRFGLVLWVLSVGEE